MHPVLRRSGALLFVLALVISGTVPASAAAASDDEFRNVSESGNVTVWERAVLPLRVDTEDAATVVPNLNLFVSVPGTDGGEVPANRGSLAVYNESDTLTLEFQSRLGADTSRFAGEDVQLLVAKVDASAAAESERELRSMPIEQGVSLLSPRNETATYELLDESQADGNGTLDSNGAATFKYDLSQPMVHGADRGAGKYIFFLVQSGRDGGFEVTDDGNLSVTGDARVLGVEGAFAQAARATVLTPAGSWDAGDSIRFSVDANLDTEAPINHAVVLYKQAGKEGDGFVNQRAVVSFDGMPSRNLSAENVTIRQSISSVYGVARADANASVLGRNLTDSRVSRGVSVPSLVEWLSERSGMNLSSQETLEPNESLPASATAVRTRNGTTTLTVETLANWSTGAYRYVYVASTDDGSTVSTRTGVLSVRSADDDSQVGDSGASAAGSVSSAGQSDTVGQSENQSQSTARRVRLRFNGSQVLSESVIQFTGSTAGPVRIEELSALPENVPAVSQENRSAVSQFHIYVPAELSNQSASLQFTLHSSAITGDPASLSLIHYNESSTEWETLETAVVERGDGTVTIEATTPGFSLFAITQGVEPRETSPTQVTPDEPQTPQQDDRQNDLQGSPDGVSGENAITGLFTGLSPILALFVIVIFGAGAFAISRRE